VLIPVFNESGNLHFLASSLQKKLANKECFYVFVDDCSTDDTIKQIEQHFASSSLHIITKNKNAGPGDSFNKGFEWILEHSHSEEDVIITMEADNTSDPEILNNMLGISAMGYDLVLASIYAQSGGLQNTTFIRVLVSFIANMFFRSVFNVKVLTLSSFYRVYHLSLIKKIKENNKKIIKEKGFICMLEILLKAIQCEAKVIEVPMVLKSENRVGQSKMKVVKTTLSYLRFLISKH
jgi:dolichol-phosphate mannosyltransferase